MAKILITQSFQKRLKKLRRHFGEKDVVEDVADFIRGGIKKGEAYLKDQMILELQIKLVKLRLYVRNVRARYLLAVIRNNDEYLPIFIDIKTGRYGQNMSLEADSQTVKMIESALEDSIQDYLEHTDQHPRMTVYELK